MLQYYRNSVEDSVEKSDETQLELHSVTERLFSTGKVASNRNRIVLVFVVCYSGANYWSLIGL